MTTWTRPIVASMIAALVFLGPAAPTAAHDGLRASFPADGENLAFPPAQVVLRYSGTADPRLSRVAIRSPAGTERVDGLAVARDGALVATLEPAGPQGVWTVDYRVAATDGRMVRGQIVFTVGDPSTVGAQNAEFSSWLLLVGGLTSLLALAGYLRATARHESALERPVPTPVG